MWRTGDAMVKFHPLDKEIIETSLLCGLLHGYYRVPVAGSGLPHFVKGHHPYLKSLSLS